MIRKIELLAFSLNNTKIICYCETEKLIIKLKPNSDELIVNKKLKKINF